MMNIMDQKDQASSTTPSSTSRVRTPEEIEALNQQIQISNSAGARIRLANGRVVTYRGKRVHSLEELEALYRQNG